MFLPDNLPEKVQSVLQEICSDELNLSEEAFFFVMNHQACCIDWVSANVCDILGPNFQNQSPISFLSFLRIIVKDDLKQFLLQQKKLRHNFPDWRRKEKMPLRIAQDVRVNSAYQNPLRLLIQQQVIQSNEKKPLWSVGSGMDISHLKELQDMSLAVFDPEGKQLALERVIGWSQEKLFTEREMDVLQLLGRGYKSKDIEKILNISLHTVRTHRRNMLKKTGLDNTTQLINFASKEGILK